MKADVIPAQLPQLEIPPWVPDVIAQYVNARYAAEVDLAYRAARRSGYGYFQHEVPDDDVVQAAVAGLLRDVVAHYRPLVADRRMEGVWRELSRRSNGAFVHPALPPFCQDTAMAALFNVALGCRTPSATMTRRQVELWRDCCRAKAAELRDDAMRMPALSWRDNLLERHHRLEAAAKAYEDYGGEVYATNFAISLERKHDGGARWVALAIGEAFDTLFGDQMYGSTAAIVSVILGREIKPGTVCKWLKAVA